MSLLSVGGMGCAWQLRLLLLDAFAGDDAAEDAFSDVAAGAGASDDDDHGEDCVSWPSVPLLSLRFGLIACSLFTSSVALMGGTQEYL